jgi:hypothetical protein
MYIGIVRSTPLSVTEFLGTDHAAGDFVAVYGVLVLGGSWLEQGIEFVLLPKAQMLDGVSQDCALMPQSMNDVLQVDDDRLDAALAAAGVPRLAGGAAYNIDALLVGKAAINQAGRTILQDVCFGVFKRAANADLCRRDEFWMAQFPERLPDLPWRGRAAWPDDRPRLEMIGNGTKE